LKEIAEVFGVTHYATVSASIGRSKKAMNKDRMLSKVFDYLAQECQLSTQQGIRDF